ncbi:DNA modification methylase [Microbacterium barkeri]|uniref:DNA modification methylase n=1 Tax=Microbacterium barkeri TaxID=33917 RepID=UPI0024AEC3E8|nr:DNA modification methylase [Microbacterium barkeri]MDI6943872.1 DNA modification methylase [Microbacterium barkeri]
MNTRALASAALAGLVILGATGCQAITSQATTIKYSASDGVNVPDAEGAPVEIRNAVIIADEEGDQGNLAAALVNRTDSAATLTLEWGDERETVRIPAESVVSLGTEETEPLLLDAIDSPAGSTLPVYFQSGDAEGVLTEVPVLDGCLEQFADLVPGGGASDCEKEAPAEHGEEGH